MKHVTYYLLVSISFPYIHTRQVGHDEGPQLLVVGELEQGHRALGAAYSIGATQKLPGGYCGTSYSLHLRHIPPPPPKPNNSRAVSSFRYTTVICVMRNLGNRKGNQPP